MLAGKAFFYELTLEEWNWLVERGPVAHETEVLFVFMALKYAVLIVDLLTLYYVYLAPQKPLTVPTIWKIAVPLAGLLAYLPCFYLIKYKAPHFLLYMDLVPSEVLSLTSLCLLGMGRHRSKRKAE